MMQPWRGFAAIGVLAPLLATLLIPAPAAAQNVTRTRVGFGYVAAAPDLMAGAAAYVIFPVAGGIGIYADAKLDASSPGRKSNFEPGLTAQQVEATLPDEYDLTADSWRSFNLALIRPLRPALSVYAGAGYAQKKKYSQYFDATRTRGVVGHYWVEDTAGKASSVNVMVGMLLRMSRFLNAQMGVESAPGSFTVGLSILLPPQ